ncbi:hypothetical protein [Agriterribacter sp.]|uniref:hypothetical protein n=1 Tax=Agriterribacter sp. TaxID=2821509 RepID=UPI002CE26B14|nr:hypothetical protein [Agriterribacter sp.]HTN06179.1 hypothetical protein [Agriterribacter sp.]
MTDCDNASKKTSVVNPELKEESIEALRTVIRTQSEWVKVHAAEFLLWSGYPEGVREIYIEEEKQFGGKSPYRIGIWRVLAQETEKPEEKKKWTNKIMYAFLDTNGADRIHAAETLAKLHISTLKEHPDATAQALKSPVKSLSLYTRWSIAFTSADSLLSVRDSFLSMATSGEEEVSSRRLAAYVVRNSGELPDAQWEPFAKAALAESGTSGLSSSLLTAAVITVPGNITSSGLYRQVYEAFLHYKDVPDKGTRMDIAAGLAEKGNAGELPVLVALLKNESPLGIEADDADVRASAAYAILKMEKRLSAK